MNKKLATIQLGYYGINSQHEMLLRQNAPSMRGQALVILKPLLKGDVTFWPITFSCRKILLNSQSVTLIFSLFHTIKKLGHGARSGGNDWCISLNSLTPQ